jgi:RNA polymerase sigma-70 factor, ECF subfamily
MMSFAPWTRPREQTHADDSTLQSRLVAGDRSALDELYRRESGAVYRYALALSGNPAWAADATHEAFVALATRPQGFDAARGELGGWLAGVARHALLALWRSEGRHAPLADIEDSGSERSGRPSGADEGASPESLLVRAQTGAEVRAAMRQLPAAMREVLVLVDLQERPYAEAARIAGVELNTLRTRLHRARLKLAALLSRDDGELR